MIVFNQDFSAVLLAKRQGEQDYDGVFAFIGGKLETTDGGLIEGLRREKDEEIGADARVSVLPTMTHNIYFQKKDGHHMILPHYVSRYDGGEITISEEYFEYQWVDVDELEAFAPKIDNIPSLVNWAIRIARASDWNEWVRLADVS